MPTLVYGPKSLDIHGFDERVHLESLRRVTKTIALFIAQWCGVSPRAGDGRAEGPSVAQAVPAWKRVCLEAHGQLQRRLLPVAAAELRVVADAHRGVARDRHLGAQASTAAFARWARRHREVAAAVQRQFLARLQVALRRDASPPTRSGGCALGANSHAPRRPSVLLATSLVLADPLSGAAARLLKPRVRSWFQARPA